MPFERSAYAVAAPAPPQPICTTRSNDAPGRPVDEPVAVPHPVRVVPDETVIVEHHEIHGSQVRGIRVELIDEVEDELLAGVGDVHRGEAGRLRLR